jgi:hypothetical protein
LRWISRSEKTIGRPGFFEPRFSRRFTGRRFRGIARLKGKKPTLANLMKSTQKEGFRATRIDSARHLEISRNGFAWRGAILSSRLARLARGVFVGKT